eukprot:COSAG02_NODE_44191_length_368_cov_0.851301_1_plen_77_part_10
MARAPQIEALLARLEEEQGVEKMPTIATGKEWLEGSGSPAGSPTPAEAMADQAESMVAAMVFSSRRRHTRSSNVTGV